MEAKVCFGFDLGAASVGSAVLGLSEKGKPQKVLHVGSRIFELPGGGSLTEFTEGKNKSPNEARRNARGARRQIQRRAKRRSRIIVLLQKYEFLEHINISEGSDRSRYFAQLDATLIEQFIAENAEYKNKLYSRPNNSQYIDPDFLQVFPYYLRGFALKEALNPIALGRALYHLSQRRGFLSNRKDDIFFETLFENNMEESIKTASEELSEEDKELTKNLGVVKKGIQTLQKAVMENGFATVGAYLASLKPSETRIRGRFTSRSMIEAEFEAIWSAQRLLHVEKSPEGLFPAFLADGAKNALHKAIFYQRPLRSQKGLVGHCSVYSQSRKASFTLPEAQEFRLLQKLNDLCWFDEQLNKHVLVDYTEKYTALYEYMLRVSTATFGRMRKVIGLSNKTRFNFENDNEKGFDGHKINARMLTVFGEDWFAMPEKKQQAILQDIRSIQKPEVLRLRGQKKYGLGAEASVVFARSLPGEGSYCSLSSKALQSFLPAMRLGKGFGELRPELTEKVYKEGLNKLPPVKNIFPELRNPVVSRCLSELRGVVNMLLRKYGLPEYMSVEMARDLKNSKKKREDIQRKQRFRRSLRKKLDDKLVSKGIKPTRYNLQKLELAEECGWQCPYTGNSISWETLFTKPIFEIEHIFPYSRTFDDSMNNKTLCHRNYNAQKRGQIPFEAAQTKEEFEIILRRVKNFYTPGNFAQSQLNLVYKDFLDGWATRRNKLERFSAENLEKYEKFLDFMLHDTQHASRLALKYLGLLYASDEQSRINVGRGGVTSKLRNMWNLNSILSDGGEKERADHRHHAIDAVVTACTTKGVLKTLQDEASGKEKEKDALRFRLNAVTKEPWEGFYTSVEEAINACMPSLRVNSKVRGKFHNETAYGYKRMPNGTDIPCYKEPIDKLIKPKTADVETIVNIVKKSVAAQWQFALSQTNSKTVKEAEVQKHALYKKLYEQFMLNKDKPVANPIRSIRTMHNDTTLTVDNNEKRFYLNASNHHTAFFEVDTAKGKVWIASQPVSLFEAVGRLRQKKTIVDKHSVENGRFLFTLNSGDCIEIVTPAGVVEYLKVRTVAAKGKGIGLEASRITDARLKSDILASKGDYFTFVNSSLQAAQCKKIIVLADGSIRYCGD